MARNEPPLRLLQGDESDLFESYNIALRAAVRKRCLASEAIIEDACSYAWEELLRRQPHRDYIFSWLRIVALHEAWRLRDRTDRELPSRAPEQYHLGVTDDLLTVASAHELVDVIRSLPPHQARIVMLLALRHRHKDISALLAVSDRSIRKALGRARRHLDVVRGAD
jgi:RNA polymerase sigma factor (sigma-70 family)